MPNLTVGRSIGTGAYGNVYLAQWEERKVAVKKFPLSQNEVQQTLDIQREINILKDLADTHIIQFYGTDYHEGQLVLVMSYAEGGSLHHAIDGHRLADWSTKERIAQEIVRGLAYIHHKGVLHRDLKSMNVLLTRHMEVKLCDFGLATTKVRAASKTTGTVKGTYRWMAPELFTARPKYSNKSDMYALGMVMWEMAADSTVPFRHQLDTPTVMALVKNGEREVLPDDTPTAYRMWVERCWEHDPISRPEARDMVIQDDDDDEYDYIRASTTSSLEAFNTSTELSRLTIVSSSDASSSKKTSDASNSTNSQVSVDLNDLLAKANNDDPDAQLRLAAMYEKGTGVPQSDTKAFKWYSRASKLGAIEGEYKVGQLSYYGRGTARDYEKAVYWMRLVADKGHIIAQKDLGFMYKNGLGVQRNYVESVAWYRKSADQGFMSAQLNLGYMYKDGLGVAQDYAEAASWFRKAADQGSAQAQYDLAWLYQEGLGVQQDYGEALSWYRQSAEKANAAAQNSVGVMYKDGLGVVRDYAEALSWFRKAAADMNASAQYHLGLMYQHGLGVDRDSRQALLWYLKSAEQGNVLAQNSLGVMFQQGFGVEQDYEKALSWYRKAAEQGNASAQCRLGWMYRHGCGVNEDDSQAFQWYRKAAEQGNATAQYHLGLSYRNGHGISKDTQQAIEWFRKAADQGDDEAKKQLKSLGWRKFFN